MGRTTLGYGVAAWVGLLALPNGHFIDVSAPAMGSHKDDGIPGDPAFVAFGFGLAYRY